MAKKVLTKINLISEYESYNDSIKNYYSELLPLIKDEKISDETAISYCFLKLEQASHRILHGGLVRIHRADTSLAMEAVDKQHLTRNGFIDFCINIFKNDTDSTKNINQSILSIIKSAEDTRDKVMHGKDVKPSEIKKAILVVLMYSSKLNDEIYRIAGFTPFGSMKGFKGRSKPLNKTTTKWLIQGIGFGRKES